MVCFPLPEFSTPLCRSLKYVWKFRTNSYDSQRHNSILLDCLRSSPFSKFLTISHRIAQKSWRKRKQSVEKFGMIPKDLQISYPFLSLSCPYMHVGLTQVNCTRRRHSTFGNTQAKLSLLTSRSSHLLCLHRRDREVAHFKLPLKQALR